jgi:hypothetical protein
VSELKSNLLAAVKPKKSVVLTEPVAGDSENDKSVDASESGEPRRKKSAVSQLIARFESQSTESTSQRSSPLPHARFSRSVTPDRGASGGTPVFSRHRSVTPDQRPASAAAGSSEQPQPPKASAKSAENLAEVAARQAKVAEEDRVDLNDNPVGKESVTPALGGESEEVVSEKEKHSRREEAVIEAANDEDGEFELGQFIYFFLGEGGGGL